jgi:hypothetical protein
VPREARGGDPWIGGVDRCDEHALDALLLEQVQVRRLARRIFAAVAQVEGEAGRVGCLLRTFGDVGEEGVGDVEHDEGNGAAGAPAQLARRLVAHEAQGVDRVTTDGTRRVNPRADRAARQGYKC